MVVTALAALGEEAEDRLRQGHAARHQRDRHVVEVRGVGALGGDDALDVQRDVLQRGVALGEEADEVLANGLEPRDVAPDGRDLAVVGESQKGWARIQAVLVLVQ